MKEGPNLSVKRGFGLSFWCGILVFSSKMNVTIIDTLKNFEYNEFEKFFENLFSRYDILTRIIGTVFEVTICRFPVVSRLLSIY